MPIPETIPVGDLNDMHLCAIAHRWGIQYRLLEALTRMAETLPFGIQIISGGRTRAHQDALGARGRPTALFSLSTHALEDESGCPREATGADLRPLVSFSFTPIVRAELGRAAVFAGLRWGGGSTVDPLTGIPSDWQHVDLGPRATHP